MSKFSPSLKDRHWTVYFFMAIYAVASVFTVVESALPGDLAQRPDQLAIFCADLLDDKGGQEKEIVAWRWVGGYPLV